MSKNTSLHMKTLNKMIGKNSRKHLFPCIKDLVTSGLTLARFSREESKPSRQDITQYVAAWFKYIGVSSDECRDWMNGYCVDVLSAISSSSKSKIRHSTKSNIKYIFKSDVTFDCGCENNLFKACCEPSCPVYEEMSNKYKERMARKSDISYEPEPEPEDIGVGVERPPCKEKYSDQFEKAMEFALNSAKKGIAQKDIVTLLNDREYKTRTGKEWAYATLRAELRKHEDADISYKEKYRDRLEKAMEFVLNSAKKGVAQKDIVTLLNDREYKTRTGKKWTYAVLHVELKKHGNADISYKEKFRDQFEKAMEFALNRFKKGDAKKDIVTLLNDREYKTRTGKKWTYAVLQAELKRHNAGEHT